jgi:tripartite-type tricarboxylate transporter receptor subunit TctC
MRRRWVAILALLAFALLEARADTVSDFYNGKIIRVMVGFGAGGGYDAYARLLSRHLGRTLPRICVSA